MSIAPCFGMANRLFAHLWCTCTRCVHTQASGVQDTHYHPGGRRHSTRTPAAASVVNHANLTGSWTNYNNWVVDNSREMANVVENMRGT